MRVLLDSNAFLWWIADSGRLSQKAYDLIGDEAHDVFVSAATAWEIATKYRLGKLPLPELTALDLSGTIARQGFAELPVGVQDAVLAGRLPGPHRDPFDRMLMAQSPDAWHGARLPGNGVRPVRGDAALVSGIRP